MQISGSGGADMIDGSADPDEIDGLAGDDHLYGHHGNDSLFGNDGNDHLAGGAGDDLLDGGAGDDRIWGGDGADTVAFRDGYGHDVVMDFEPGVDKVSLVSSGITDWQDVQDHLFTDADGTAILILDDGSSLRFEGRTVSDLQEGDFILPPAPVCLVAGTRIATPRGQVAVETLSPGDLVLTLDDGPQRLLWIGRRQTRFGHGAHRHQPVRIAAGAMGHGLPVADLWVSPQHRLLVRGPDARRFARGALAKAKGLCGRDGIAQDHDCTMAEYFQLLLPRHGLLLANGLPVESFLPRGFALKSLDPACRDRLHSLWPALVRDPERAYGPPARPILPMHLLQSLPPAALMVPAKPALTHAA